MYEDLERLCTSIAKKVFWAEGWSAVRETAYYDSKGFTPDVTAHLARIEAILQRLDLGEVLLAGKTAIHRTDKSSATNWPRSTASTPLASADVGTCRRDFR